MQSVFFYNPSPPLLRNQPNWRWWLKVWLPVVIAIAVICCESTDTFSAANTSSWLRPIVQRFFGVVADSTWDSFHHFVRKTGHFVGYGTVGFTFLRAWLHTLGRRGPDSLLSWRVESTILAVMSTAVIASADEFHQAFLPSRTGTPVDVLLDTMGASTLCLIVWLVCWSRRTRAEASYTPGS